MKPRPTLPPLWLTVGEAAPKLGVTVSEVLVLCQTGRVSAVASVVGARRHYRLSQFAIDEYLRERSAMRSKRPQNRTKYRRSLKIREAG